MIPTAQLQRDIVLGRAECMRLLAAGSLGRVIFIAQALPAVQPVAFTLDGDNVLFRARAGSSLADGTRNDIIAFQVDDIDLNQTDEHWWTVTVIGPSQIVTDPAEINRLETLTLDAAAPEDAHFVLIRIDVIQGWRRRARPIESNVPPPG